MPPRAFMDVYNLFPVFCFQRHKDMWYLKIFWFISLKCLILFKGWASVLVPSPNNPRQRRLSRRKSTNDVHGTYVPVMPPGQKSVDSAPGRSPWQPSLHPEHVACSVAAWASILAQARLGARGVLSSSQQMGQPSGKGSSSEILLSSFFPNGLCYKKQIKQPLFLSSMKLADGHPVYPKAPGCLLPACRCLLLLEAGKKNVPSTGEWKAS